MKTKFRTLSLLSRCSQTTHQLLTPLLYRHLILTQDQLIKLLTCPSDNYALVRSLTLTALGQSFDISSTQAFRFRKSRPSQQAHLRTSGHANVGADADADGPLFPNATILKFSDYVGFAPPGFQYLPHLLKCERLIIDTRVYSWRVTCIPPLWSGLKVIELHCRNWTCPFIAPGIHHIIHLSSAASPFRDRPRYNPYPSSEDEDAEDQDDVDPDHPSNGAYRHLLEMTFRWLVHCIENISKAEQAEQKGVTTCELKLVVGGAKEIRWAEKNTASMLLESGLGEGRVKVDEDGEMKLTCLKFTLEND